MRPIDLFVLPPIPDINYVDLRDGYIQGSSGCEKPGVNHSESLLYGFFVGSQDRLSMSDSNIISKKINLLSRWALGEIVDDI